MDGFTGFSIAKRKMVEAIDNRMEALRVQKGQIMAKETHIPNLDDYRVVHAKMQELENMRNYIRNVLLWKAE